MKGKKTGGRQVGSVNRDSATVKAAILAAYKTAGGDKAFGLWAKANPDLFYTRVLTRVVPTEVNAEVSGGVSIVIERAGDG